MRKLITNLCFAGGLIALLSYPLASIAFMAVVLITSRTLDFIDTKP
jgi:hypothetical protein